MITLYEMLATELPRIIQGGMGVGISGWRLAKTVSTSGYLGVVSGTASDALLARILEDGDPGGHYRRALEAFPIPEIANNVLREHYRAQGRLPSTPYRSLKMMQVPMLASRSELIMTATFAEVWLAKESHNNPVGINLLTKVQLPTPASLYGAMLAGVDVVLMGAGIPREIPGVLDNLALHKSVSIRLDLASPQAGEVVELTFDPQQHLQGQLADLKRPHFLAIISSNSLATMLVRRSNGEVNGFVVEAPVAGGHNAPPRGDVQLSESGEPIYSSRDAVDLDALRELGLPFWLAGGTGYKGSLDHCISKGAHGIQIGTLMAFSNESGMDATLRAKAIEAANQGRLTVFTDPRASPTGYPFKIVEFNNNEAAPPRRVRKCDLGYLRTPYRLPDGRISHRCPAEPVATYVAKGGTVEETEGRECLCNALLATTGHGQVRRNGAIEQPIVTAGDQARELGKFLNGRSSYSATDVLAFVSEKVATELVADVLA